MPLYRDPIARQTLNQKPNRQRGSRQENRYDSPAAPRRNPAPHPFLRALPHISLPFVSSRLPSRAYWTRKHAAATLLLPNCMLRFYTAGESHGQALLAFISGLPASLPVDVDFINHELHRRQLGYGRGGRQKIEKDRAEVFAGVRHGKTIGAPVALRIENRDWANWEKALPVEDSPDLIGQDKKLVAPRPGHADLAGSQKFNFHDARYILERASARETAARVAAAAF